MRTAVLEPRLIPKPQEADGWTLAPRLPPIGWCASTSQAGQPTTSNLSQHAPPQPQSRSPDQRLVVEVPNGDVAVAAAGEADFGVRADGQGVAGGGRGGQLRLDAGGGGGQVPDGERAGLPAHNQGASVREELAGADVVVSVLEAGRRRVSPTASECLAAPDTRTILLAKTHWGRGGALVAQSTQLACPTTHVGVAEHRLTYRDQEELLL